MKNNIGVELFIMNTLVPELHLNMKKRFYTFYYVLVRCCKTGIR